MPTIPKRQLMYWEKANPPNPSSMLLTQNIRLTNGRKPIETISIEIHCVLCAKQKVLDRVATITDHINPVEEGGSFYDKSNH